MRIQLRKERHFVRFAILASCQSQNKSKNNKEQNQMKKMMTATLGLALIALLAGCDPTKTGGGGYQQPYDSGTGQYK